MAGFYPAKRSDSKVSSGGGAATADELEELVHVAKLRGGSIRVAMKELGWEVFFTIRDGEKRYIFLVRVKKDEPTIH